MPSLTLTIIFIILLALGIILTALPTVPGLLYMFIVTIVYGLVTDFATLTWQHYLIFGGLMLLAGVIDYLSGLIGAKFGGASRKSLSFGLIGLVIGLILFPPFGLVPGLLAGIFISELVQFQDHKKALKAATYSFFGLLGGMVVSVLLAITFLVVFLIAVF